MRRYKLTDQYIISQASIVRSIESSPQELKDALREMGREIGKKVIEKFYIKDIEIVTPMGSKTTSPFPQIPLSLVFTTKGDMEHFGSGLSKSLRNSIIGYMNFEGRRGTEALDSPIRDIMLPSVKGKKIDSILIAKSVLATGCTAISLTRKALSEYVPDKVIIVAAFYSTRGLDDLTAEFPNAHIFVVGDPDDLEENGLLVPSIGLLEERLTA